MNTRKFMDNFGMHVVLTLFGMGVGYLIGAYVQSIREEGKGEFMAKQALSRYKPPVSDEDGPPKLTRVGQQRLDDLCERYSVTALQVQMVKANIITLDQLEAELERNLRDLEEGVGKTNYAQFKAHSQVERMIGGNKPDLEELIDEVVNEWADDELMSKDLSPYRIFLTPPTIELEDRVSYIFDPPTGAMYQYVRGKLKKISTDVFEKNENLLDTVVPLFGDVETVYILDSTTDILYEIREDPENAFEEAPPKKTVRTRKKTEANEET